MYIIFSVLWDFDVCIVFVLLYFTSILYRARLYTVFDRIFDFDWHVMERGGGGLGGLPKAALAQGPAKA